MTYAVVMGVSLTVVISKLTINFGLGAGVAVDLTTAILLIHQLHRSRKQSPFSRCVLFMLALYWLSHVTTGRTKTIIQTLINYAVGTGAVTV